MNLTNLQYSVLTFKHIFPLAPYTAKKSTSTKDCRRVVCVAGTDKNDMCVDRDAWQSGASFKRMALGGELKNICKVWTNNK